MDFYNKRYENPGRSTGIANNGWNYLPYAQSKSTNRYIHREKPSLLRNMHTYPYLSKMPKNLYLNKNTPDEEYNALYERNFHQKNLSTIPMYYNPHGMRYNPFTNIYGPYFENPNTFFKNDLRNTNVYRNTIEMNQPNQLYNSKINEENRSFHREINYIPDRSTMCNVQNSPLLVEQYPLVQEKLPENPTTIQRIHDDSDCVVLFKKPRLQNNNPQSPANLNKQFQLNPKAETFQATTTFQGNKTVLEATNSNEVTVQKTGTQNSFESFNAENNTESISNELDSMDETAKAVYILNALHPSTPAEDPIFMFQMENGLENTTFNNTDGNKITQGSNSMKSSSSLSKLINTDFEMTAEREVPEVDQIFQSELALQFLENLSLNSSSLLDNDDFGKFITEEKELEKQKNDICNEVSNVENVTGSETGKKQKANNNSEISTNNMMRTIINSSDGQKLLFDAPVISINQQNHISCKNPAEISEKAVSSFNLEALENFYNSMSYQLESSFTNYLCTKGEILDNKINLNSLSNDGSTLKSKFNHDSKPANSDLDTNKFKETDFPFSHVLISDPQADDLATSLSSVTNYILDGSYEFNEKDFPYSHILDSNSQGNDLETSINLVTNHILEQPIERDSSAFDDVTGSNYEKNLLNVVENDLIKAAKLKGKADKKKNNNKTKDLSNSDFISEENNLAKRNRVCSNRTTGDEIVSFRNAKAQTVMTSAKCDVSTQYDILHVNSINCSSDELQRPILKNLRKRNIYVREEEKNVTCCQTQENKKKREIIRNNDKSNQNIGIEDNGIKVKKESTSKEKTSDKKTKKYTEHQEKGLKKFKKYVKGGLTKMHDMYLGNKNLVESTANARGGNQLDQKNAVSSTEHKKTISKNRNKTDTEIESPAQKKRKIEKCSDSESPEKLRKNDSTNLKNSSRIRTRSFYQKVKFNKN